MIRFRSYICAIALMILTAFPAFAAETSAQSTQFCDTLTAAPAVDVSQEAALDVLSVVRRSVDDPGDAEDSLNGEETDSLTVACMALNTVIDPIERYDKRVVSL